MAAQKESKPQKSGGSCLGKLVLLFVLAGGLGVLGCFYFIAQPQSLTDIGGYGPAAKEVRGRDMKVVLQNSIDRDFAVTLTETELNQWLARNLQTKQGGLLASQVSLERMWVRLDDGVAELILERKIMGYPITVSMFLQINQTEGAEFAKTEIIRNGGLYHESLPFLSRGGRFGQLVVPQGFLLLVLPAYEKLPDMFHDEIELAINKMARIKIEKNRLILDPSEPTSVLPKTF